MPQESPCPFPNSRRRKPDSPVSLRRERSSQNEQLNQSRRWYLNCFGMRKRWLVSFSSEAHMQSLLQDLRFAFRQMARTPGFSLTAILSLALGIGATVSVFSVIYSAVLNAWPYAGFDRVCQINTIDKSGTRRRAGLHRAPGSPTAPGACGGRRGRHEPVEPGHHRQATCRKTCTRFTLPEMPSNISACRRFSAATSCPRTRLTGRILNR